MFNSTDTAVQWQTLARACLQGMVVIAVFFAPAVVFAAGDGISADPGWGKLLQVLAALGLTLGVIYALAYVLKRMRLISPSRTPVFTVMGSMALSPREKLYLVQVGQQQLVLGSSSKGLEALHVMQENIELATHDLHPGAAFDGVLERFSREKS